MNRSESIVSSRPRELANERGTTAVAARGIAQQGARSGEGRTPGIRTRDLLLAALKRAPGAV